MGKPYSIEHIKKKLNNPLPGRGAQLRMAPKNRDVLPPDKDKSKLAAVSVILFQSNIDELGLYLIKRTEYPGHHSGQISFPGGKKEHKDDDLLHTSIRETKEEIGLNLSRENLVGQLTPLFIPVSNFLVHPFVFYLNAYKEPSPDNREVEQVINCSVRMLKACMHEQSVIEIGGKKIHTPYYNIQHHVVWGATAMILSELDDIVD